MASPFDYLKPLIGQALENALNRALALDPDTQAALVPLDGRRIALHLASPPLALEIRVAGNALHVGPAFEENEADLSVRGSLAGLLAQLPLPGLRRDDAPALGKLRVSGDAELARRMQTLAQRFDPDWQQPFVRAFGDVVGVQVAETLRKAFQHAKSLGAGLAGNAAAFVTEESRDVVARAELNAFHDDVDALRDDAERLAARIRRLGGTA